jgi:hypothetical protein
MEALSPHHDKQAAEEVQGTKAVRGSARMQSAKPLLTRISYLGIAAR